jgi:prepilin-type N-terminal cleavage/methylation domain-containing protein/prepilin-type processing-associated H-X9-DG protein
LILILADLLISPIKEENRSMSRSLIRRRGFTLIELLVVIAIIGILVALLLPAVQKVRESAGRAQCQNNMKQMGLALHMYHDSFLLFPWGHQDTVSTEPTVCPASVGGTGMGLPWSVMILPFLEQNALYSQFNILAGCNQTPNCDGSSTSLGTNKVKTYICPSSPSNGQVIQDNWDYLPANNGPWPPTGYDANGNPYPGAWQNTFYISLSDYVSTSGVGSSYKNPLLALAPYNNTFVYPEPANGVMQDNQQYRITDITDGTSNTSLVGELGGRGNLWVMGQILDSPPYSLGYGAPSGGGWEDTFAGENWLEALPSPPLPSSFCPINCVNAAGYYSFHGVGANFLLADGSVRMVSTSTAPWIVMELITLNSGFPMPQLP